MPDIGEVPSFSLAKLDIVREVAEPGRQAGRRAAIGGVERVGAGAQRAGWCRGPEVGVDPVHDERGDRDVGVVQPRREELGFVDGVAAG